MNTITIGADLAKNGFSVCKVSASGRVLLRRGLRGDAFSVWLAQTQLGTVETMEACSGARRCVDYQ